MVEVLKSKIAWIVALMTIALSAIAFSPGLAFAQAQPNINNNLCAGADTMQFGGQGDCNTAAQGTQDKVNNLVTQIVNIFSVLVGIAAVIMIVFGGFRYITSGGDSGRVTNAKNTILYAIIGLVIVALAQLIVKFVLAKATGLN